MSCFCRSNPVANCIVRTYLRGPAATQFVEFQSLPTRGARDWEAFLIAGDPYLAVANRYDDLKVYKWNGASFAEFQSIPTLTACDLEFFKVAGEPYLAVANHRDGNSYNTLSKLYKWNGARQRERSAKIKLKIKKTCFEN